jgi:hypothetical protein
MEKLFFLCAALALLSLQACDRGEPEKKGEGGMRQINAKAYEMKPPVDVEAPVRTQTATFALG